MALREVNAEEKLIESAVRERHRRQSGTSRAVAAVSLLVLVGLGLFLIFGVYPGNPNNDSAPQCNGDTMAPGDICDQYDNGVHTHSYTYQDMLHQQQASHPIALVFGIIALVIAVGVLLGMRELDPAKPWGKERPENCPRCGETALREKAMSYSRRYGNIRRTWSGLVILCTPACGFTTVRKP